MRSAYVLPVSALIAVGTFSVASSTPLSSAFGAVAGYNVVAIGSNAIAGTISVSSDSGRLAASSKILNAASIGPIANDTFGNANGYDFVSAGGYSGGYVNIQSAGNAYSPGGGQFNFNGGGHLVTSGASPLDFASLRTMFDNLSANIFMLPDTGTVTPGPNRLVLTGTSLTANIFDVTAGELATATDGLAINAPSGSTVIVNVISDQGAGANIAVPKLFYNGAQTNGDSPADSNILFNFYQDTNAVTFTGQFSASVLAPYATLTGNSQLDGQFIAAAFNVTGEVHNVEFTGVIPNADPGMAATPEPSGLMLLGTGVSAIAAVVRRRRNSTAA